MTIESKICQPRYEKPREIRVQTAIGTFTAIVQDAAESRKHGQFGLVVSMRDGLIGTLALHKVETVK